MRGMMMCVLALAACTPAASTPASPAPASAVAVAAPLAGTYALQQINGRALPANSPTESNVEISRGQMILGNDGAFTASLTGRRNQEPTPGTESMSGTYRVEGDFLMLSVNRAPGPRYGFTRTGTALTLRDDAGNLFTFQRQP